MQDSELQEMTTKTIRFENELLNKILKMCIDNERDFSAQVRFMLKEYIKLKERD